MFLGEDQLVFFLRFTSSKQNRVFFSVLFAIKDTQNIFSHLVSQKREKKKINALSIVNEETFLIAQWHQTVRPCKLGVCFKWSSSEILASE